MSRSRVIRLLWLSLVIGVAACVRADRVPTAVRAAELEPAAQNQSAATATQSFTAITGGDLKARREQAERQASGPQPYWLAYAFDVRPGVAVDPAIHEFHGSMNTVGETSIFIGTTANGLTVETRNLAIFSLRVPGNPLVSRVEIYNLERLREYGGYRVFWLGRANNDESLAYLQELASAAPLSLLGERAVLGIALHDDAHVGSLLKSFVGSSQNERVRSSAIYWLGQVGGEQAFLADTVRNESEDRKFRRQAAHAIGESRDRGTLALLVSLYDTVKDSEVHRSIVQAVGDNQDQESAFAFLLKAARTDPDREARRTAVRQLGQFERDNAVDELMKIYANDQDTEVKRTVLHSLGESKNLKAQARLLDLARSEQNPDLRRQAIHIMAERGEAVVDDLIKLYDGEHTADVQRTVLQSLAEIKGTRAEDKLFAVARADSNLDLRRQAIRLLGERAGKRSLDFLNATVQSTDGNTEVQLQAVRSIGERPIEEAVPLLLKIARTHPNQQVRKQAIRLLGESGDPRAVEYFREVLTK